jgi:predicted GIY-YIG superfamily endonuclease
MSFWVYMLRCADGSFYVGHTDGLERRLGQHAEGTFRGYTHSRRPVTLVYSAELPTREEALEAEWRIKGWSRAKKSALINGDWATISALGRKKF